MELKLFTNLIDALGKVADGLKAIGNLPKAKRATMRQTLDETYRLFDTTLNILIIQMSDILLIAAGDNFLLRWQSGQPLRACFRRRDNEISLNRA
jgi:hypothetical protein